MTEDSDSPTADVAENFLKQQRDEKVGKELVFKDLSDKVKDALTSDFAETIETEEWDPGITAHKSRFLRRQIYFKSFDEDSTAARYQLAITIHGHTINLARIIDNPHQDVEVSNRDNINLFLIDNKKKLTNRVNLHLTSAGELTSSVTAGGTQGEDGFIDPDMAGFQAYYGVISQGESPLGTLESLLIMRDVLTNGSVDIDANRRSIEHMREKTQGISIEDPSVLEAVSPYMLKVMNKVLPALQDLKRFIK